MTQAVNRQASDEIISALLDDIINAYNARDVDTIMSFFAEDAIFDSAVGTSMHGGRFEGKAAIREAISNAFEIVERLHYTAQDVNIVGDKAYCEIRRKSALKSGELIDILMVDVITFRDGLMVHKDTYYKQRTD